MAGLLGKIKSNSGYLETKLSPSEKPRAIPSIKGLEREVAPIQAGCRTVDERFYHPTGGESYYYREKKFKKFLHFFYSVNKTLGHAGIEPSRVG
ncbi:MAG: hypothetical protein WB683_17995 [Candidatus Sulfotelmatobacter sp.]